MQATPKIESGIVSHLEKKQNRKLLWVNPGSRSANAVCTIYHCWLQKRN